MIHFLLRWRITRTLLFLFGILLIFSLCRSIIAFWQRGGIVTEEERRWQKLVRRNEELKKEFAQTQTPEFIERVARDKLNLSRVGESVVILPPITPTIFPSPIPTLAPWQEWAQLFHL